MGKELQQLKVVLNLFNNYLEKVGCDKATFSLDAWELKMNDKWFYCGEKGRLYPPIPMDKFIEDYMDYLKGTGNLEEFSEDGDQEYYGYEFIVLRESRKVKVMGEYSAYIEGDSHDGFIDTDEIPGNILRFLEELDDSGHGEFEVICTGGGDSGFVEDDGRTRKDDNYKTPSEVENYCYQLLEQFPGWEINEGSHSEFYFDGLKRAVSFTFTYNEEVSRAELVHEFDF
jgi:hypothetical protein